jgi:hypothetical protein
VNARTAPQRLTGTPYAVIACRVGRLPGLGLAFLTLAGGLALLLAALHPTPGPWLALTAPPLAGLWRAWHTGGPGFRPGWTLQWHAGGGWWLGAPEAKGPVPARLLPGGLHHGRLTLLVFRLADGRCVAALLGRGNLPPAAWRRLRVRLGWPAGARTP